jgi:hypothetical protein
VEAVFKQGCFRYYLLQELPGEFEPCADTFKRLAVNGERRTLLTRTFTDLYQ